jgi:hypothetical protein
MRVGGLHRPDADGAVRRGCCTLLLHYLADGRHFSVKMGMHSEPMIYATRGW